MSIMSVSLGLAVVAEGLTVAVDIGLDIFCTSRGQRHLRHRDDPNHEHQCMLLIAVASCSYPASPPKEAVAPHAPSAAWASVTWGTLTFCRCHGQTPPQALAKQKSGIPPLRLSACTLCLLHGGSGLTWQVAAWW